MNGEAKEGTSEVSGGERERAERRRGIERSRVRARTRVPERTHLVYRAAGGAKARKCVCVKQRESERASEREREREERRGWEEGGSKERESEKVCVRGGERERERGREGGSKSSCRNRGIYTIPGAPGHDRAHADISVYAHGVACVETCV